MKKNKKKPLIPQTKNAAKPKVQQGNIDLKMASDLELKGAAYDQLLLKEHCQTNIQAIHQELAQRAQQGRAVVRPDANEKTGG